MAAERVHLTGRVAAGLAAFLTAAAALSWAQAPAVDQPWQRLYTGTDATAADVVALWQFDAGAEVRDGSGHGRDLVLRGQSRFVAEGKFGGGLECFPADSSNDKEQGVRAKNHPDLSPPGAFTLELWIRPKPELAGAKQAFLLDKKLYHYFKDAPEANHDYCLFLSRRGDERWEITANLGFGKDSALFTSQPVALDTGVWRHIAFTYDGAGLGRFYLDGCTVGRTLHEGRGGVDPGKLDLVIGDRIGSTHSGFPGFIDQVRVSRGALPFFSGSVEFSAEGGRTVFVRMEKDATLPILVHNGTGKTLRDLALDAAAEGLRPAAKRAADLGPDGELRLDLPVDTTVRPGRYAVRVHLRALAGDVPCTVDRELMVTVVPRATPLTMPVVMWGTGDLPRLTEIGFTHHLQSVADNERVWKAGEVTDAQTPGVAATTAVRLDEHLAAGVGALCYLQPGRWVETNKGLAGRYRRVDAGGKPYERENTCCLFPEVQTFSYNVGASVARTFGRFPALQGALIHSEIRDSTAICHHPHDDQACRQALGFDRPAEAVSKGGVRYTALRGFPANRIIPDNHPLLVYYRWFWKEGDGWNRLHTLVHKGLKSGARKDLWTFFDPAVRVPSVWGSGGNVDFLSQWTYSYPDPIKIGQATDELFAMAEGTPGQQVMKMTQVIWYRSGTAPKLPADESRRAQWEKEIPDARFITIAPDHLREAFWCMIARPVRGIMYHGWGSLVSADHGAYRFTNPDTAPALQQLTRDVIRPLGPTLLQVGDRPADVVVLESFASQMFAGRGSWGWSNSWAADAHLILQWAHLQPRVVYEETILRDGLEGVRVLVMPNCDVLPAGVAQRILEFQRHGGILVGDENLAPGMVPDILLAAYRRTGRADADKAALLAQAAALRTELDPFYTRYGDTTNPEIVLRFRQQSKTDYLFAINDKRTFGDYVGHHGKVMEKGLPTTATLTVRRPAGYVYDLVAHRTVPGMLTDGLLSFNAEFGPGEGRLFMIADRPIARVTLRAAAAAGRATAVPVVMTVEDAAGALVPGTVPCELEVLDPAGARAERSGYYAAVDGRLAVVLDVAPNDPVGVWRVKAKELASSQTAEIALTVRP